MTKTITAGILCAASAFAQSQADLIDKLKAELQEKAFVISSERFSESTVVGAPYAAEETNTTTQTLFDGNRIINGSTTKIFRDQQGRTRVERALSNIGPLATGQPATSITISDPVSHSRYNLDPDSKTAYKSSTMIGGSITDARLLQIKIATEELRSQVKAVSADRNAKQEDLGSSNMAGVPVKGTRSTQVILAGTMGNDRDINIVDERWYSPDLKMNIMTKHSDPRTGETIFQVTNLTRSYPDPSLFQVPADYQIKEGVHPAFRFTTTKE